MITFEGIDRRRETIDKCLKANGLGSLEEARSLLESKGVDAFAIVRGIQSSASMMPAGLTYLAVQ